MKRPTQIATNTCPSTGSSDLSTGPSSSAPSSTMATKALATTTSAWGTIAISMTMTASMYSNAIMIPSPTTPLRNGKR